MEKPQLHKVQMSILKTLRRNEGVRFSEMMRPTGMESDNFKFYLRRLVADGVVERHVDGLYRLTTQGKEFANNLDLDRKSVQKQPKLSVLLYMAREDEQATQFLLQRRLRQPYHGFWAHISGPVKWGEQIEEAAARELAKQTGLTATFNVRSFYRAQDYNDDSGQLLEDKLFAIVEARNIRGELSNTWSGGDNRWMTMNELKAQSKYFKLTYELDDILKSDASYVSKCLTYDLAEY